MEKVGLVSGNLYGDKPPINDEYCLTDFGKTFVPVLDAITHWGNQIALEKGEFTQLPK